MYLFFFNFVETVFFLLSIIISGCVCAFRCCGNLRNEENENVRKAVQRVDSLRAEVIRRGSQLRRSLSRSPKFSIRDDNPMDASFFTDANTTIVSEILQKNKFLMANSGKCFRTI
uniref:Uncharacterized protein n=1 Tax=Ascaris lumbricoides TaxID=6252 RepID=A0A0M3IUK9_ASCLU